jgi:UDP-GlcNAc:undecaprenyl-phosphate GlcNAc-1-phosphate transferase
MPSTLSFASDAILVGALVAELLVLTHAQRIGEALRVMDQPDHIRKRHSHVTPLVGGLAIMVPLLICTGATIVRGEASDDRFELAILLCGAAAALLGYTDDQSPISPSSRLLSLFLLTAIALVIAPQLLPARLISGVLPSLPLAPWAAYGLITIATPGFVSSVNMADGQNGIVMGMFVIWSTCLMIVTGGFEQDLSRVLLVASALAFFFNISGKVFLGDGGTYGVSFILGLLAICAHNAWGVSAATIAVWFFIPVADCVRLIISRAMNGRAPSDGDRNHFHHRLEAHVGRRGGLIVYLGAVAVPSLVATRFPQLAMPCLLVLLLFYLSLTWFDAELIHEVRYGALEAREKKFSPVANNLALIEVQERNVDAG